MARSALALALWTVMAGAGIPMVGVLNSGMARSIGSPFGATAVMFAVAFAAATGVALVLHGAPTLRALGAAPISSYGAGLLIGFYAITATIIIPRFGAGNFITFILIAQLVTAALIDQFGLFGMTRSPMNAIKFGGFAFILCGLVLVQVAGRTATPP